MALLLAVVALLLPSCGAFLLEPIGPSEPTPARPEQTVVHIFYVNPDSPNDRKASGTGFMISDDGVIATAAHVVEADGLIDVKFGRPDGSTSVFVPARVITSDHARDIALIQVDAKEVPAHVRTAVLSSAAAQIGNPIAIYGFPESDIVGLQMRRSSGTISSLRDNPIDRNDRITKMLELEAKIEPGNSGSPVFNDLGQVIGVVSSRWKTTDSYALATPAAVVQDLVEHHYKADMASAVADMEKIPTAYQDRVKGAYELAIKMRNVFPHNSEGERLVAQLEHCMGRALREGELGKEALASGDVATAWRHLQILRYEARAHEQDIAFLISAHESLGISIVGGQ